MAHWPFPTDRPAYKVSAVPEGTAEVFCGILTEVLLCVVAVDSSGFCQSCNSCALGGLTGAVGTDGVTQNTGAPGGGSVGVNRCNVHSLGQVLG